MNAIESLHNVAMNKFITLMGEEKGKALFAEILRDAGLKELIHAGDLLVFAEVLLRRRGVFAAIGRSLKIQAIFLGAATE